MLETALKIYHKKIATASFALLEKTRSDCMGLQAEMAKNGMYRSGRTVVSLEEIIKGAEAVLAETALRTLIECYTAAGVKITGENSEHVAQQVYETMTSYSEDFRQVMYDLPLFRAEKPLVDIAESRSRLNAAQERAFQDVQSAIDLLALKNEGPQETPVNSQPQMVFNAPVQQVISGTGNSGTVYVEDSSKQELIRALRKVIEALQSGAVDGADEALAEVAKEAVVELEKPAPNRFKLSGLLSGLDKGISIIPKARTAYEVLKPIIQWLGSTTPP